MSEQSASRSTLLTSAERLKLLRERSVPAAEPHLRPDSFDARHVEHQLSQSAEGRIATINSRFEQISRRAEYDYAFSSLPGLCRAALNRAGERER